MRMRVGLLCAVLLLAGIQVLAQEESVTDCPTIVQNAYDFTENNCSLTELNQACYGSTLSDARPRPGIDLNTFNFSIPGDVEDVLQIESLQLSALDELTGDWGLVLLEIAANLVEGQTTTTAAGDAEDVQLLLFGNTELRDASVFLPVTISADAVPRALPRQDSEIVTDMDLSGELVANGRTDGDEWFRLRDNVNNLSAWFMADMVTLDEDIETLPVVMSAGENNLSNDPASAFGPLQAFYFESGREDAPCQEAPNSGLLIQTPEGDAEVSLWLDEVVIQVTDGTAFAQADAGGALTINLLSGSAQVTANGETVELNANEAVDIELDDELGATSTPSEPRPIDPDDVQGIGRAVNLLDNAQSGVPQQGNWSYTFAQEVVECADGTQNVFASSTAPSTLTVSADSISYGGLIYNRRNTGIYSATYTDGSGSLHVDTLEVISPTFIRGEKTLDLASTVCMLTVPFSLSFVGG